MVDPVPLRLLSITPFAERAGSDQALLRLVRSLPRDHFDVHIVVPAPSPLAAEYADAGATLHVVPMRHISTSHGARAWLAYLAAWPVTVTRVAQLVRRLDIDVVHTNSLHSLYGWAAARMTRRPHVWHAREIVIQSRAALGLERFLCRHFADRVVAVSQAVAEQLDPANVVVLDDPFDPTSFAPSHAGRFRASAGLPDDAPLVGSVARLDPLKGLDVVLDAFPAIARGRPGARLVLAGGPVVGQEQYEVELRRRVDGTPGARLFEAMPDVAALVADLDVLVLASVEPESYGLVLVEALAAGARVVATDLGGPREIVGRVTAEAGRLVPPGDAGALAQAVLDVLPAATSTGARRARAATLVTVAADFTGLFSDIAGRGRSRRH